MSVPEAVWNEIRALEQANAAMKTRIDELHDQIAATARRVDRIAALESPAPAPDPVCTENCDGSCQKCEDAMFERMYGGGDEVPTAEPEQAPLDPVLVDEIAALIANRVLHPNEVFMTGPYRVPSEERRCKEAAQEIVYMLTNGRDGAR